MFETKTYDVVRVGGDGSVRGGPAFEETPRFTFHFLAIIDTHDGAKSSVGHYQQYLTRFR